MPSRLLLLFLLGVLAVTLHTPSHDLATTSSSYLPGLIARENNMVKSMAAALLDYQAITSSIQSSGVYTSAEINVAISYLGAQRLALANLSNYINLQLNPAPCNSTPGAVSARSSLQSESTKLKAGVMSFRTAIVNCVNCPITSQINQLILGQQNYIQVIDQIISSNCTQAPPPLPPQNATALVNVGLSKYKDNLQAKNWIYGNITANQYKLQVFTSTIQYNLTSCPITKPYVNPVTQICFNCPPGMNYSLGQRTCLQCLNNFVFNLVTLVCQSPCNISQFFNTTTKTCQPIPVAVTAGLCPASSPLWNATIVGCQACASSTPLYNTTLNTCQSCPTNTVWDATLSKCIPVCATGQYYNSAFGACIVIPACSPGNVWNITAKVCQPLCGNGTFYYNITQQCLPIVAHNCSAVKPIWNPVSLKCQLCPQSTPVWNATTKLCQPCPASAPVFNYTSFTCGPKICSTGFKWNPHLLKCTALNQTCPLPNEGYVFLLGRCVPMCQTGHTYIPQNNSCSCFPSLPYFNSTTRLCQAPVCPSGSKWNPLVKRCVTLNQTCASWQVYNFTQGGCINVCPVNIPYIKPSNACNCTARLPTFNFTTRTCVAPVCFPNTKWNTFLLRCSPLNGNCAAWQSYNFTTQFCKTVCHNHVPYIASNNSCACPPQTPIFNATDRYCQEPVCPFGYLWNTLLLRCVKLNVSCSSWQAYNFTVAKCINMCLVNQTYIKKYNNCTCPPQVPYFNNTLRNCTIPPCLNGTKWNTNLLACTLLNKTCLSWQQWNFTNASCQNMCQFNQTWFPANKTCTCPPHTPFYNSTLKNCTIPPCKNGTKWNPKLLNCTPLVQACPLAWQKWIWATGKCVVVCPVNSTYDNKTNNCTCPPVFPIFNNVTRQCLEPICPAGLLWNRYLFKCALAAKNCSTWQRFNFNNQSCVQKCPINVTYISRSNTCICPPSAPLYIPANISCVVPNCTKGYKYNANLISCSPLVGNCSAWQAFNFTNQSCITMCPLNHTYYASNKSCSCPPSFPLYNSTTKNCTGLACKAGLKWNPNFQKCMPAVLKCQIWQKFNFTLQACENFCPVNHTYFANNTCQCFPNAPIYNPVNRTCLVPNCSNGTKWDPTLVKCEPLKGNCSAWQIYNFSSALCVTMCPIYQAYHPSTGACQCPPQVPFWDNITKTCTPAACPVGYRYNPYLMKCSSLVGLCAVNQFYDFTTQQCITKCQAGHQYYVNNNTCQCFPTMPYFNSTSMLCSIPVCKNGTVWNTNLLVCQSLVGNCLPWQLYNFTQGACFNMCPLNQVYFPSNGTCSCYPSHPVYNISTKQCQIPVCLYGQTWSTSFLRCRCPNGNLFNSSNLICQPVCNPGSVINYGLNLCQPICSANQFINTLNQCQCHAHYIPIPNSNGCMIPCASGLFYDPTTLRCEPICSINMIVNTANHCQCLANFVINVNGPGCRLKCPNGLHYNSRNFQCQPLCGLHQYVNTSNLCQCNIGFLANANGIGCVSQCSSGFYYNTAIAACSPLCGAQLFLNGTNQCQCNSGLMFNPAGSGCVPAVCQSGYSYNTINFRCEPVCGVNMFVNSLNLCQCSSGYVPNVNGNGCHIACSSGFVYNSTTLVCSPVCASNMLVNATNQCQCIPGYILNINGVGCRAHCAFGYYYNSATLACQKVACPAGYQFNAVIKICEKTSIICPPGTFYNNIAKKCESCPAGYTYNPATNTCEVGIAAICPAGYVFDPTTKLCNLIVHNCPGGQIFSIVANRCVMSFITSPTAGNLVTNNMTNYTAYYNAQLKANPGIKNCAAPTPYYDPAAKGCVKCPLSHPYFNLDVLHCQNCGGLIYSSTLNRCVANAVRINPTIGRFVSNVF